jgi:hypothetical protein
VICQKKWFVVKKNFIHLYYDFNKDTEKTAEFLLQINAIKLNPRNPFSWALVGNLFIVTTD